MSITHRKHHLAICVHRMGKFFQSSLSTREVLGRSCLRVLISCPHLCSVCESSCPTTWPSPTPPKARCHFPVSGSLLGLNEGMSQALFEVLVRRAQWPQARWLVIDFPGLSIQRRFAPISRLNTWRSTGAFDPRVSPQSLACRDVICRKRDPQLSVSRPQQWGVPFS